MYETKTAEESNGIDAYTIACLEMKVVRGEITFPLLSITDSAYYEEPADIVFFQNVQERPCALLRYERKKKSSGDFPDSYQLLFSYPFAEGEQEGKQYLVQCGAKKPREWPLNTLALFPDSQKNYCSLGLGKKNTE